MKLDQSSAQSWNKYIVFLFSIVPYILDNRTIEKMALYFVTISPRYRPSNPLALYNDDISDIRRYFNRMSRHYILYPEWDAYSRLHYHGIITIHDTMKLHKQKYLLDRVLGYTMFKPIKTFDDHLKTLYYSMKDWPKNSVYFKTPILYCTLKRNKIKAQLNPKAKEFDNIPHSNILLCLKRIETEARTMNNTITS